MVHHLYIKNGIACLSVCYRELLSHLRNILFQQGSYKTAATQLYSCLAECKDLVIECFCTLLKMQQWCTDWGGRGRLLVCPQHFLF